MPADTCKQRLSSHNKQEGRSSCSNQEKQRALAPGEGTIVAREATETGKLRENKKGEEEPEKTEIQRGEYRLAFYRNCLPPRASAPVSAPGEEESEKQKYREESIGWPSIAIVPLPEHQPPSLHRVKINSPVTVDVCVPPAGQPLDWLDPAQSVRLG
uniref:Uncharacterized protein n=1 Tax=Populus trichocarpa TaxID=3694 RepID=U7DYG3_POPTR